MITLTMAYGRDCKSQKEIKKLWDENKDFIIADMFHPYSGKYCNKQDMEGQSGIMVRYNGNRSIMKVQ